MAKCKNIFCARNLPEDNKKQDSSSSPSLKLSDMLCCTRCGEQRETFSEIVYSQGEKICTECKKITIEDDKRAFDRDMNLKRLPQMIAT